MLQQTVATCFKLRFDEYGGVAVEAGGPSPVHFQYQRESPGVLGLGVPTYANLFVIHHFI